MNTSKNTTTNRAPIKKNAMQPIGSAGFFSFGKLSQKDLDLAEYIDKKEWVSFGKNNDTPDELLKLYENASPLHTALVDKAAQMIAGSGFVKDLISESINDNLFFENRFSDDDLDEIAQKLSFDIAIFNGGYIQVIFDEKGLKIAQLEHIPFQNVRAEKSLDEIEGWYVSRDWQNPKNENEPVRYAAFSPELAKVKGEDFKSQILPIRVYSAGMKYYPKPAYKACIPALKASYSLNNYNAKAIENGFNAGTIIINKGIYTPEEQRALHSDVKKKYTGSDEANDFILLFAPTEESVPEIVPIATNMTDGRFLNLKNSIIDEIIVGHKASSQVAGKETAGKLGSRQEIKEAHDIFNSVVIKPLQKKIEDAFNWLAEVNGLTSEFKLNDYDFLEFSDEVDNGQAVLNALNSLSPLMANKVLEAMTSDEIRALVGLAPSEPATTSAEQPEQQIEPINEPNKAA